MEIRGVLESLLLGSLLACANDAREVDEIPGLKLAESVTAVQDDVFNDPDVTTWRPAIRIMQDGATMAGDAAGVWTDWSHANDLDGTHLGPRPSFFSFLRRRGRTEPNPWPYDEQLYDPDEPVDWHWSLLEEKLYSITYSMARESINGTPAPSRPFTMIDGKPSGQVVTFRHGPDSLPNEALLIRADEFSRFYYTQKILEIGSYKGIQLWKYHLATSGGKILRVYLPKDLGVDGVVDPVTGKELNSVEVTIKVKNEGNKLDESGVRPYDPSRDMRFIYDDTRDVTYHVGPSSYRDLEELEQRLSSLQEELNFQTGSIDARPGTLTQEAVNVFDRLILAGFEKIAIVGSYED
jgi:hypothetical protein